MGELEREKEEREKVPVPVQKREQKVGRERPGKALEPEKQWGMPRRWQAY